MELREHLLNPTTSWSQGTGPDADVVLSTRVRLARNLAHVRFPGHQTHDEAVEVLTLVERAAAILGPEWDFYRLSGQTPADRRVLVDKHLISPLLAKHFEDAGLALNTDESGSLMVNEEDHVRLQVLVSGRDLEGAWQRATGLDDRLEADLEFAFDPLLGYLEASPANIGTGIRVSAMVHLPVLVLTGRVGTVLNAVQKLGYTVRGLYGEGTEAVGNLFQVSNQRALGLSEEEIVGHFDQVLQQLIAAERQVRTEFHQQFSYQLADRVGRAYGILTGAQILTTAEAMRLISDARLGVSLGLLPGADYRTVHDLLVVSRSGYLARVAGRELPAVERDVLRARLIRERLMQAPAP